jgi:hypothetical protein
VSGFGPTCSEVSVAREDEVPVPVPDVTVTVNGDELLV